MVADRLPVDPKLTSFSRWERPWRSATPVDDISSPHAVFSTRRCTVPLVPH